jgi:hypothetical protein
MYQPLSLLVGDLLPQVSIIDDTIAPACNMSVVCVRACVHACVVCVCVLCVCVVCVCVCVCVRAWCVSCRVACVRECVAVRTSKTTWRPDR